MTGNEETPVESDGRESDGKHVGYGQGDAGGGSDADAGGGSDADASGDSDGERDQDRRGEDSSAAVGGAYDRLASTYATDLESNPYNADLEFPGTTDLVPDVAGKRILDAGCGTGRYSEWLLDAGADAVLAVDASGEMLDEARDTLDGRSEDFDGTVEFHRADLAEPLDVAGPDAFDGVVSGLVLDYLEDWRPVFEEFARVLRPGGFVVFSVPHPADEFPLAEEESYFQTRRKTKEWAVEIPYYARPLSAMVNPVLDAGFRLEEIAEPEPTEGFREKRPDRYEKESRHPVFVAFRFVLPSN